MPLGGCGISGSFITSISEFSEGSGGGGDGRCLYFNFQKARGHGARLRTLIARGI